MTHDPFKYFQPSRLTKKKIIGIAESEISLYRQLHREVDTSLFSIAFDQVFDELIYPHYQIQLDEDCDLGLADGQKVLGCYVPEENTIYLDSSFQDMSDNGRWKRAFTAWHELGHAILHRKWLLEDGKTSAKTVEASLYSINMTRMEQQANWFAAYAAAPQWFLDETIQRTFSLVNPIRYTGPNIYDLYPTGCKRSRSVTSLNDLCRSVASFIRHKFGELSIEALSYRVQESRWIVDLSTPLPPAFAPRPMRRTFVRSSEIMNAWQTKVLRKAVVTRNNVCAGTF